MNRENKRWVFGAALTALVLLSGLAGLEYLKYSLSDADQENAERGKHYVAVITKSTDSAFWQSVFAGARAAGTEYNLELTFSGPENEEDYEKQNQLVKEAVENGAEALVFSSVDYEKNAEVIDAAANAGVIIVVIDSDVNSSQVSSRISTDNFEAGKIAGKAALAVPGDELNVGIVNFDKNSANGQEREKGFRECAAEDDRVRLLDAINVKSTIEDAMEGTEEMIKRHPQINVIVTFNEWTSLGVGYAIQQLGLQEETTVIAFDSNVVSVGMLETGEVDALVVQNPFAMGYLGVECAYDLIFGSESVPERIDTATTVVTKENMYDEECQRVLFAFD